MRLWSLHPQYLDRQGLLAVWREGLLAQKVLQDRTTGYRNHPQLARFKQQRDSLAAIASYLHAIHSEASARGYAFDATKIAKGKTSRRVKCTEGQLEYEFNHLRDKLRRRDRARFLELADVKTAQPHPLFLRVRGGVEPWEKRLQKR
jgi:hypothetical protein